LEERGAWRVRNGKPKGRMDHWRGLGVQQREARGGMGHVNVSANWKASDVYVLLLDRREPVIITNFGCQAKYSLFHDLKY